MKLQHYFMIAGLLIGIGALYFNYKNYQALEQDCNCGKINNPVAPLE